METCFSSTNTAVRSTLETFLVEWKPYSKVPSRGPSPYLETFLVEWKLFEAIEGVLTSAP